MAGLLFPFLPGGDAAEINVVGTPAISAWVVNDALVTIGADVETPPPGQRRPIYIRPKRRVQHVTGEPAIWSWHVNTARTTLGDPIDDYAEDLAVFLALSKEYA